jgi:hypothetical protein
MHVLMPFVWKSFMIMHNMTAEIILENQYADFEVDHAAVC